MRLFSLHAGAKGVETAVELGRSRGPRAAARQLRQRIERAPALAVARRGHRFHRASSKNPASSGAASIQTDSLLVARSRERFTVESDSSMWAATSSSVIDS